MAARLGSAFCPKVARKSLKGPLRFLLGPYIDQPPSTRWICPVVKALSSEAR